LNPKDKEVTPLSVVFLVFKIVYWPFTLIYYAFDNALKKSEDLTIKYTNYNSQYEVSSKLSQLSLRETLILEKIPEADLPRFLTKPNNDVQKSPYLYGNNCKTNHKRGATKWYENQVI
ncbi:MAG: hypothetical protein JJT78_12865, partial [Leptospira sp.]|nr:hypothetical protein [Leptospira sp.]